MKTKLTTLVALALAALPGLASAAQLDLSRYKELYPSLTATERAVYEKALAAEAQAAQTTWSNQINGPVQGDLCTAPVPGPVVPPFLSSSTTVGAANNYDIATVCGTGQTLFGGTGASLDVAYGIMTDANCQVTLTADPTGTSWDLAVFVLQAAGAACTQLPSLADPQCITMDDDGGSNITETVTWAATAGTEYYVIIDGFNAATGTFDLTVSATGCNFTPVELMSFGVN